MNDTCPQCLHRDNQPTSHTPEHDGTTCRYRCRRCRHTWTTTWAHPNATNPYDDWEPRAAFDEAS